MSNINHWNSYGVFCMAMSLKDINTRELDILFTTAIHKYDIFVQSEFNDINKPEIECINEFVKFYNF